MAYHSRYWKKLEDITKILAQILEGTHMYMSDDAKKVLQTLYDEYKCTGKKQSVLLEKIY